MIDQYNRYHFENNFFGNPKTCGALSVYQLGEMHCCPTTVVSPHCQQCYELTYVLSGKGKTVTNGTETVLSPGDCSVNFPGDTHSIVSDRENPLRYAFCGFMPDPADRVPLMLLEKCAAAETSGCAACADDRAALVDRRHKRFPILREEPHRSILFNCVPTYAAENPPAGGQHFIFSTERPAEILRVLDAYRRRLPPTGEIRRLK